MTLNRSLRKQNSFSCILPFIKQTVYEKILLSFFSVFFYSANGQTSIFSYGSSWKYLANGTNQGTAWTGTGFSDAAWSSGNGQFGYGDGDEATVVSYGPSATTKYITTYFRKISIANTATFSSFTANVKRDDGIIVYINGVERYRNNIATGTVTYTTLATSASDDGATQQTFTIARIVCKREQYHCRGNTPECDQH